MKLRVFALFYKRICWLTLTVTLINGVVFSMDMALLTFVTLFWSKVITTALALLYVQLFEKERLYFFFNLGLSAVRLYVFAFVADVLFWLLLILIIRLIV